MKKLKLRGAYFAAVAGAIAGAAIGIPAWAASSGGDSGSQANVVRKAPPRGAPAFGIEAPGFPSAAEAKRLHEQMSEFDSCLREHGADVPGISVRRHGALIQVPRPQAGSVMRKAAQACGVPPPPAPSEVLPPRSQIEKNRKAMDKAIAHDHCLPLPPGMPTR